MTEGTSQGLFVVVAIVIFGLFVGLSYTLFGSEGLSTSLENLFTQAFPSDTKSSFDKNAEYNVANVVPSEESDFLFDGIDTIIGYIGTDTEVVIPNTIDGLAVTKISGDAFNDKGITKLIMPNSITTIEDGSIVTSTAFNNTDSVDKESTTLFSNNASFIMTVSAAEEVSSTKTVIGAFANNEIKEISFSANLESIGTFAFFSGNLEDVVLPDGLLTIGESAFEENLITEIEIPATVETLGDSSFKGNALTEVKYTSGSKLKSIGSNVFSGNSIDKIAIPKGTTTISDNAYSNAGLESVTIPQGVTKIGTNAFNNNKLREVNIPNGVTVIGKNAFSNNLLEEVVIPDTVQEIDNGAFKENILTNVDLPEGLQRIGEYAFYKNKLPIVKLPESLLLIGQHAFEYNELLDVTIPSKLTTIKEWTFAYNKMPSKPVIPINITTEEDYAFYGNLFDEKVTFTDTNLANAIASVLGVSVDNITQSKLETIKTLNISSKNVTNLQGLENAINLESFTATNNTIVDVSPLAKLTKLRVLELSKNKIINMYSITSLVTVQVLNLSENSVIDVGNITNMQALNSLNLEKNPLSSKSLSTLEGLSSTIPNLRFKVVTYSGLSPAAYDDSTSTYHRGSGTLYWVGDLTGKTMRISGYPGGGNWLYATFYGSSGKALLTSLPFKGYTATTQTLTVPSGAVRLTFTAQNMTPTFSIIISK